MASVMDLDDNFLILDEIVVRDRVYKLEQFRQSFDLQPIGEQLTVGAFSGQTNRL